MSASQLLLRRLLEQAGGPGESGYVLVLEGEGLGDLPESITTPRGVYRVDRVGTEIGLRHLLWKARGAPVIAVLPDGLAQQLQRSPDLLRGAQNRRVHALAVNDVLEVLLGVRVVGADTDFLRNLALENVDKLGMALSRRTLPTVVDRRLLTELLVDASVGERVRTATPAELLGGWIQEPPRWSENVIRLVCSALPTMHGDEGRLLSWALGAERPGDRLRQLVVHGALLTVEAEDVPKKVWGPLWSAATEPPLEMDRRLLRHTLRRLAEDTLAVLGDAGRDLLTEADTQARQLHSPKDLPTSRVLPLAFEDRCFALAKQAAKGKPVTAAEIAWLSSHRAAPMRRAELAVLEAMARLSRYLDTPMPEPGDVAAQVREYQRHGAFADLAALQLRRALASSASHHTEARQLLRRVRERRDADNRRFAETLATGYEAALHSAECTPLHRIWKRTVAPVWQQAPDAPIYLVVLDGCSYPVFLELLYELSQDSSFPIGIPADEEGAVIGMPALSPLPTITSHARGAIFLGELPNDGLIAETVFRDQVEAKTDKARFNQNQALGSRTRKLFLKGDLGDGGQALLATLADPDMAVVGVVFNAVDDQIGSSNTGATVRIAASDIVAFQPSLRAALRAGRRVLLTADHGHSPFVSKSLRAGAGKAPRYLELEPGAPPPEGYLTVDVGSLGGAPSPRAFAWKTGVYFGNPQVGFHGGCGLEEMVVPLAWLEREGLQADEPHWWFGRGVLPEVQAPAVVAPPILTPHPSAPATTKKKKKPAKAQLGLFDPGAGAEALGLDPELLEKLTADEKAVLMLLRDNGSARASELADRLRKNPGRLNGLMRTLRRKLHRQGLLLFADEVLPSGETLYRYQAPEGTS